jgi:hypothetical protein
MYSADDLPALGEQRLVGQRLRDCLGDAEVDHLHEMRVPLAAVRDEDVRRLDVAMNDALHVRVLHGVAHGGEELEPLADGQAVAVCEPSDRLALHILHREEGLSRRGDAAVEDARDVRVVHHRERLALLLEARDDGARVHARLDDLDRDALHHGLAALGEPHLSEAALADHLEELVRPDHFSGPCAGREIGVAGRPRWRGAMFGTRAKRTREVVRWSACG